MITPFFSRYLDRNNRLFYYTQSIFHYFYPSEKRQSQRQQLLTTSSPQIDQTTVRQRVNYYNKLNHHFSPEKDWPTIKTMRKEPKNVYLFDAWQYLNYFPHGSQLSYAFGDRRTLPSVPGLVKSRPIMDNDQNAVAILLKLEKARHFYFIHDQQNFCDKKNKLIWCGNAKKQHRKQVIQQYHNHPLCYMTQTNHLLSNETWHRRYISIREQLQYKFILSIEGNDVATNLKWIMSSNSLCFMKKPQVETWFMEGLLKPGYHYVLVNDDYSDLPDKISYYLQHPSEAEAMIHHANQYTLQFKNKMQEDIIALKVLEKYFKFSNQL